MNIRNLPPRLATGVYILHSGLEKWDGPPERAAGLQKMASAVYPIFGALPPTTFMRVLAAWEITLGAALLTPFVPPGLAGMGLTAFSGALLGVYFKTPGLRQEGSIWPTQQGIGLSKDVWMFGIGLGLLVDAALPRRGRRRRRD